MQAVIPQGTKYRLELLHFMARQMCAKHNDFLPHHFYVDQHWRDFMPMAEAALDAMVNFRPGTQH